LSEFRTSIDIANRACQHLGQTRIGAAGFNEASRPAREIGAVFDVLRRAELERNPWRFAIRLTVLRAIDTDTMLLAPSLWTAEPPISPARSSATTTCSGFRAFPTTSIWSRASAGWDLYFGPLTAALYDSTITYAAGEIVYTTPGDGTNRVYLSLQSDNADNPATATAWAATVTYRKNDVVTYSAVAYMSLIDLNTNNTPSAAPQLWDDRSPPIRSATRSAASDGVIYTSATNGNLGNDPVTDGGTNWTNTGVLNPWTRTFVGGLRLDQMAADRRRRVSLRRHAHHVRPALSARRRAVLAGEQPQRVPPAGRLPETGAAGPQGRIDVVARRADQPRLRRLGFPGRLSGQLRERPDHVPLHRRRGERAADEQHVLRRARRAPRARDLRDHHAVAREDRHHRPDLRKVHARRAAAELHRDRPRRAAARRLARVQA
jgi:hypothetical protein